MHAKQLSLQVKLMAREAADRLEDAAVLSSAPDSISDSPYLLTLLAFEILLKATLRIHGRDAPQSHKYRKLFASLPETVRGRLLALAAARLNSIDYSKLDEFLDLWSRNFVALRYPYDKYKGLTEKQYLARGAAWMLKGAPEAEADFLYKHEELDGLTEALQQEVQGWLKDHPQRSPAVDARVVRQPDSRIQGGSLPHDYWQYCEELWHRWISGALAPSAYLRANFDLDAAPEPWLPLFPGARPLVALTTNPGGTLQKVALQRRPDITSGLSPAKPDASYAEAAKELAAYYTRTLTGPARVRNNALARLSQLAGFDGVLGVECCPFHSPTTPHKAALVRASATDPLLSGYVGALRGLLAVGSVVAVSAVSTRALLCRGLPLSPWLNWQAELLGLVAQEAECIPLVTKNQKVTCAALVARGHTGARALVLMMGGNHLPGEDGLLRLAEALRATGAGGRSGRLDGGVDG